MVMCVVVSVDVLLWSIIAVIVIIVCVVISVDVATVVVVWTSKLNWMGLIGLEWKEMKWWNELESNELIELRAEWTYWIKSWMNWLWIKKWELNWAYLNWMNGTGWFRTELNTNWTYRAEAYRNWLWTKSGMKLELNQIGIKLEWTYGHWTTELNSHKMNRKWIKLKWRRNELT